MRTLVEQAAAVAAKDVSPVELVEATLASIERTQPQTNAWTHVLADEALQRAKELADSPPTGPLHGVPIGIKDLYDVEGIATSGGCAAYLERIATEDSPVVANLRAAGAIVVGKTNMHELAFGPTSQLSCFGPVRNPWDTTRIPGGSSGGSGAAVASRTVLMAMGSDTGGSIRIPSTLCGITGLKPTHGAVSLRGALPMTASFDTGGPLAVTAEDCITVHRVIAGYDVDYVYSRTGTQIATKPVDQLRIGVPTNWYADCAEEIREAVLAASKLLEGLGATLVEREGLVPAGMRGELGAVLIGEFAHHFRDIWDDPRVSPNPHALLEAGRGVLAIDHARGRELALQTQKDFMRDFEEVDLLLTPGQPQTAILAEGSDPVRDAVSLTLYTMPVNAAGLPAIVFPVGLSVDRLPMGAQLIGPPWSEELLAATAGAFQQQTDFHLNVAPIA